MAPASRATCAEDTREPWFWRGVTTCAGGSRVFCTGGQQILPESWVSRATTPIVETRPGQSGRTREYGYQWWVLPTVAGDPSGYGGQRLIVVPSKDLVAVVISWNVYEQPEFAPFDAFDCVLAAVR